MIGKEYKISVVVPVYGVESHIARCVRSLMEQTMTDDVEFVFVDDATKDRSIEILENVLADYPRLGKQIQIIRHEKNKGLPAARNTGLAIAKGEYIINFDSDDFLESTILEKLYLRAQNDNLDFVWCDWNQVKNGGYVRIEEPSYDDAQDALKGMLIGPMHYNVWNKLIRRSLFTDYQISFPEGYSMGEDMTMMMVAECEKKVGKVDGALYNYVRYDNRTITSDYTDAHIASLKHNVERVCEFVGKLLPGKFDKELALMKLGVKSVFLVSGVKLRLFKAWQTTFPEANQYIGENPRALKRIVVLEWFASKKLFFFVVLYNVLVVNLYNKLRHK